MPNFLTKSLKSITVELDDAVGHSVDVPRNNVQNRGLVLAEMQVDEFYIFLF